MSVYDIPSECNEDTGHHIVADICKCEYDKKEQNRKRINELIIELQKEVENWGNTMKAAYIIDKIKELSK